MTGNITISVGRIVISNAKALGTTAGTTTIQSGGELDISGGSLSISEPIFVAGTGAGGGGALVNMTLNSLTNTLSGTVTLAGDGTFSTASGSAINFTGSVGESGGSRNLTLAGRGSIFFTSSTGNSYSGFTKVTGGSNLWLNGGATTIQGDLTIGDGTNASVLQDQASNQIKTTSTVTVANSSTFRLLGATSESIGSLHLQSTVSTSATASVGSGTLTLASGGNLTTDSGSSSTFSGKLAVAAGAHTFDLSSDLTLPALSGAGDVAKTGTATLTLSGDNSTFDGALDIDGGSVKISNANALGSSTKGTTIGADGHLLLSGGITSAEPITIAGTTSGAGAIDAVDGNETLSATIAINANTYLSAESAATLILTGVVTDGVSGGGTITKINPGTVRFTNAGNAFGVTTNLIAQAGAINVLATAPLGSANLQATNGGSFTLSGGLMIANPITIDGYGVSGSGAIQSNGGTNIWSGPITLSANAGIGVWANTLQVSDVVGSSNDELRESGWSTLIIAGTPTFAGTIDVLPTTTSTLQVDGTLPAASLIKVENHATLDGTGRAGKVTVYSGGHFSPGHSPGTITTTGMTLNTGSQYDEEINGTNAGQYDVTQVIGTPGTVALGNATLNVTLEYTPTVGDTFTILTAVNGITGTMKDSQGNTLTDGSTLHVGHQSFLVNYTSTSVVLTALQPSSTWSGAAGTGDTRWSTAANWVGASAPVAGDTLIFPSGPSNLSTSNDLTAGTRFVSVEIDATGYTFTGNAIALDSGLTTTYTTGSVTFPINTALNNDQAFTIAAGGSLDFTGAIMGAKALTKAGGGTLVLDGVNTYSGGMAINAGIAQVQSASALGTGDATLVAELDIGNVTVNNNVIVKAGSPVLWGIGSNSILAGNVTLNSDLTVSASSSYQLTISGAIGEAGGARKIIKTGNNIVALSHANGYSGGTDLQAGILDVFDTAATGTSGTVTMAEGTRLGQYVASYNLPSGGLRIGTGSQYSAATGSMIVTVNGSIVLTGTAEFYTSAGTDLIVSGVISDGGGGHGLLKTGTRSLTLTNSNTFKGLTTVGDGTLELNNPVAPAFTGNLQVGDGFGEVDSAVVQFLTGGQLASTSNVSLEKDGKFDLNGYDQTVASLDFTGGDVTIGAGTLTMGGDVTTHASANQANISATSGEIDLGASTRTFNAERGTASYDLNVSAPISGSGVGLTKAGSGALELSGSAANSYSGLTMVNDGLVFLAKTSGAAISGDLTIGDATGGTGSAVVSFLGGNEMAATSNVIIESDGSLGLDGFDQAIGTLSMTGGSLSTGAGTLTLGGDVTATSATVSGTNYAATISGTIDLGTASRTFNVNSGPNPALDLDILAAFSGNGAGLTKAGTGVMSLGGASSNTYDGMTTVTDGTLQLAHSGGTVAIPIDLTVGDGTGLPNSAVVSFLAGGQMLPTAHVFFEQDGKLDLNSKTQDITALDFTGGSITTGTGVLGLLGDVTTHAGGGQASITGTGQLALSGTRSFTVADDPAATTDLLISTVVSGTGGGLVKSGPGLLDLTGTNTYDVTTTVNAGTLTVDGRLSSSTTLDNPSTFLNGSGQVEGSVTVNTGATLAGNLTTGDVTATRGTVSPGNSPGIIHTGDFTLDGSSTCAIELDGTTVGTQYDQVDATGTISLGNATLNVTLGYSPREGDTYTIIKNHGIDPVSGTFAGLPEGGSFSVGSTTFSISYQGGTGKDVVLTAHLGPQFTVALNGSDLLLQNVTGNATAVALNTTATTKEFHIRSVKPVTVTEVGAAGNFAFTNNTTTDVTVTLVNPISNLATFKYLGNAQDDALTVGTASNGFDLGEFSASCGFVMDTTTTSGGSDSLTVANAATVSGSGSFTTTSISGVNSLTSIQTSATGWVVASGSGITLVAGNGAKAITLNAPLGVDPLTASNISLQGASVTLDNGLLSASTLAIDTGLLTIGDTAGDAGSAVVQLTADGQISGGDTTSVVLASDGKLALHGHDQTIGLLTMTGGTIDAWAGTLTLSGDVVATSATIGGSSESATISGNVALPYVTRTFTVADGPNAVDLVVSARVSGSGSLTKNGTGVMRFSGDASNIYTGLTTVAEGTLELDHTGGTLAITGHLTVGSGLGAFNSAVVRDMASAQMDPALVTVLSDGWLDLNGFNDSIGALSMTGGSVTTGAGTLTVVSVTATSATIGVVDYAAGISGNLALATPASTYTFEVGDGPGAVDLDVSAILGSSSVGLTKWGDGVLRFSGSAGSNSYTGLTTVEQGPLELDHTGGTQAVSGDLKVGDDLGAVGTAVVRLLAQNQMPSSTNVVVRSDGSLDFNGFDQTVASLAMTGGTIVTGSGTLTLDGDLSATSATVEATSYPATISGNLNLSAVHPDHFFTVTPGPNAFDLAIPAVISGEDLIKQGAGTLRLNGATADNTFKYLFATEGRTELAMSGEFVATKELAVGNASGPSLSPEVRFLASHQLRVDHILHLWQSGLLNLNGFDQTINDVTVAGGQVSTGSGSLTVTGSISSSIFTNETTTIEGNLDLGGGTVDLLVGDYLTGVPELIIDGVISDGSVTQDIGPAALQPGTVQFTGSSSNLYTGTTTVNQGTLELNKSGGAMAIVGDLTIGDGTGEPATALVQFLAGGSLNPGSNVQVRSDGKFDLNGFYQTVGSLTMAGGAVASGAGLLTLGGDVTSLAGDTTATISGRLDLGGTVRTFEVARGTASVDLDVSAAIGGGGDAFIKTGSGVLTLSGATPDTFASRTVVRDGMLVLDKSAGLAVLGALEIGDGSGLINSAVVRFLANDQCADTVAVTIKGDGLLDLNGEDQTIASLDMTGGAVTTATGSITLAGNATATSVMVSNAVHSATISGNLDLSPTPSAHYFTVNPGPSSVDLDVSAVISGANLHKLGTGDLRLDGSNDNTFAYLFADEGLTELDMTGGHVATNTLVVEQGETANTPAEIRFLASEQLRTDTAITVGKSGLLNLDGFNQTTSDLTFRGGEVRTGTGSLKLTNHLSMLPMFSKETARITGQVDLTGASVTFTIDRCAFAAPDLIVDGTISDGSLTLQRSLVGLYPGVVQFIGTTSNTYTGRTTIQSGKLELGKTGGAVAIPGDLTIGDGTAVPGGTQVKLLAPDQLAPTSVVTLKSDGLLDLNNFDQSLAAFDFTGGSVTTGVGLLVLGGGVTTHPSDSRATINGRLDLGTGQTFDVAAGTSGIDLVVGASLSGSNAGLTKAGAGELALTGAPGAGFTGTVQTLAGRLDFNNEFRNPVEVADGATIGGTGGDPYVLPGFTGPISVDSGGTLSAGTGTSAGHTGILDAASASFASSATNLPVFQTRILGETAGEEFDELRTTRLSLGDAVLDVQLGGTFHPVPGTTFPIISGPAGDVGQFHGLPEGAHFLVSGVGFSITYLGGAGGHDVVLTALAIPVVTVVATPVPCIYGQQATITSTVSGSYGTPTGTVEFHDGDPAGGGFLVGSGVLSGGTATFVTPINSLLASGMHQLYARYLGDLTYDQTTSDPHAYTISRADTSTTVVSAPSPSIYGQTVSLLAQVMNVSVTAPIPVGVVRFFDGATQIGGDADLGPTGLATITVSTLSVAGSPHTITAAYLGNSNFQESTSAPLSQTVSKAETSTSLSAVPVTTLFGQSVLFKAQVSSWTGHLTDDPNYGTVQLYDGNPATGIPIGTPIAVDASGFAQTALLSNLSPGTHSIACVYSGNNDFSGSQGSVPFVVQVVATTTTIASAANPTFYGQAATFTAFVRPTSSYTLPTPGTVRFYDGTTWLGDAMLNSVNQASLAVSALNVGSHAVTAVYLGAVGFQGSTSNTVTQQVNKNQSVVVLSYETMPMTGISKAAPAALARAKQVVVFTVLVHPAGAPAFAVNGGTITLYQSNGRFVATLPVKDGRAAMPRLLCQVYNKVYFAIYNNTSDLARARSNPIRITAAPIKAPTPKSTTVKATSTALVHPRATHAVALENGRLSILKHARR